MFAVNSLTNANDPIVSVLLIKNITSLAAVEQSVNVYTGAVLATNCLSLLHSGTYVILNIIKPGVPAFGWRVPGF